MKGLLLHAIPIIIYVLYTKTYYSLLLNNKVISNPAHQRRHPQCVCVWSRARVSVCPCVRLCVFVCDRVCVCNPPPPPNTHTLPPFISRNRPFWGRGTCTSPSPRGWLARGASRHSFCHILWSRPFGHVPWSRPFGHVPLVTSGSTRPAGRVPVPIGAGSDERGAVRAVRCACA